MRQRPLATRLILLFALLVLLPAAAAAVGDEPPSPLSVKGQRNLEAFARLLGYVRFFHASDEAAAMTKADWESFALAGVQEVEGARNRFELAYTLNRLFEPVAPLVSVWPLGPPGLAAHRLGERSGFPRHGSLRWLGWYHNGVDVDSTVSNSYQSARVELGTVPEGSVFFLAQDLNVELLAGTSAVISATARAELGSPDAVAEMQLVAFTGSGVEFFAAPVLSDSWHRVEIEADLPPDTFFLDFYFFGAGEVTLDLDDFQITADGYDADAAIFNPGMETGALAGFPPPGWLPARSPFSAGYRLELADGDPFEGQWFARMSGPEPLPVPWPAVRALGGGVTAVVPLAVPANDEGTLPHRDPPPAPPTPDKPAGWVPSGEDRTTRLAGVALAWGVLEHFYPYFDVVPADWDGAFEDALASAATDPDGAAYFDTLNRLMVELYDGHARIEHPVYSDTVRFAFTWDWIEGELVITSVEDGATHGMAVGDRVLEVGGVAAADALADVLGGVSGATEQWRAFIALRRLASGHPGESAILTVAPRAGGPPFTVTAPYSVPVGSAIGGLGSPEEPRPEIVEELEPGIFYVDLTRIDTGGFYAALWDLAAADGIVFDLRGFPWFIGPEVLSHLTDVPRAAPWLGVPQVTRPDRPPLFWDRFSWVVHPYFPHISARRAFLVDGRLISWGETFMSFIEEYDLGEIVGGPTAGTNGVINPFTVPGDYTVRWSGMQVLKRDGSQHHGVGILPTLPQGRTLSGLLAGSDEVLERGIEAVRLP